MVRAHRVHLNRDPAVAYDDLFVGIADAIEEARRTAVRAVNGVMTATYWFIGMRIVEHEQQGAVRAAYGRKLLARLA